jgi:hypothetical protein
MAFTPLSPSERASIEAQVLMKASVELTVAEINNGDEGVAVTMAVDNAIALAQGLSQVKETLLKQTVADVQPVVNVTDATATAIATVVEAFPQAQPVTQGLQRPSLYIDDSQYAIVNKLLMHERAIGITYGSQQSAFMDNQAIRKLFAAGIRQFPDDYWAESMRGKDIPITKNGKCGLGDFKIKRGTSLNEDGSHTVSQGEGDHPLANKSGYFGGLVKHSPFTWGERPDAIDPQNWLAAIA